MKILIADSSLLSTEFITDQLIYPHTLTSDLVRVLLTTGDGDHTHLSQSAGDSDGTSSVFNMEDTLVVLNKTDLLPPNLLREWRTSCEEGGGEMKLCWLSCKTEDGVKEFMLQLRDTLEQM